MSRRSVRLAVSLFLLAGTLIAPGRLDAQGNGRPKAPKGKPGTPSAPAPVPTPAPAPTPTPQQPAAPTPTQSTVSAPVTTIETSSSASTAAPAPVASVIAFRQFGSWLDDASAPTRGEGSTSIAIGHWRMNGMSQTNAPMLGASLGLTDRLQVSASVPFYRVNYEGTTFSGLDDVYIGGKYTIVDPTLTISEFGLSINPVMEVLSAGALDGRVHFAIPVAMEVRRAPLRVYGSAGYFTRGSVFTGGAVEWATTARLILTGALTQSYSIKEDPVLDGLAIGRQRIDVTASAAYPLGTVAVGFASVGRSVNSPLGGGTSLAMTGGVSFRFAPATSTP